MGDPSGIDWRMVLLGEEDWNFVWQIVPRSIFMFCLVLISLRVFGKLALKQGIFEIAMIISLGSAAGDAMFYSKVGLLTTFVVFVSIAVFFKFLGFLLARIPALERVLEGAVVPLIEDGEFTIKTIRRNHYGMNKIYGDLREKDVSQLGQVRRAYIEPSGSISVFPYPKEETKYGLSLLPEELDKGISAITTPGKYACRFCGYTSDYTAGVNFRCPRCNREKCVPAVRHLKE